MDFTVRIANTNIRIHSIYSGIYNMCKEYLICDDEKIDIEITTDTPMIEAEIMQSEKKSGLIYSSKAAEELLVQRMLTEALLTRNTLLMHGAVVAIDNAAYMFTGHSGTGKTTHIRKWLEIVENAYVVNGDKPFVIINEKGAFVCGSPWCGKECMGSNTIVPLRSIVFMKRNDVNCIQSVEFKEILPLLLEQTYYTTDAVKMKKTLQLLLKLKEYVSFYSFRFNNHKEDAFSTSYNVLTNLTSV